MRPEYYHTWDVVRRNDFDPRPRRFVQMELDEEGLVDFVKNIQMNRTEEASCWELMLPVTYQDFAIPDGDPTLDLVGSLCGQFLDNLYDSVLSDPNLVDGTEGQSDSDVWHLIRAFFITASVSKRCVTLSSPDAMMNFLRQHLWGLNPFKGNAATRYGQKHEPRARRAYARWLRKKDSSWRVEETGLWQKQEYPFLACSPDALVFKGDRFVKVCEIKCPKVLEKFHPKHFHSELTETQLANFPLERDSVGIVSLKRNHSHYYQVQFQMDVMKVEMCDYFVWSPHGFLKLNIPYNEKFWLPIRQALVSFYKGVMLPEYFLYRTPMLLPPLQFDIAVDEDN